MKAKNTIYRRAEVLMICVLLIAPVFSFAAPNVTNVSGTLTDGSIFTVTGSGFGANGPTIKLYDEFESGANGSIISVATGSATINEWTRGDVDKIGLTTYTNEWAHSGTKSMKNNWDSLDIEPRNQMMLDFSDASEIFYSFWSMVPTGKLLPGDPAGGGPVINWKFTWLWGGTFNNPHADEYFSPCIPGQQFGTPHTLWFSYNTSQGRNGNYGKPDAGLLTTDHMTKGEWSRVDQYIKGELAPNGILEAVETDATHGRIVRINKTNVFTLETGYFWNHLTIPGFAKGQTTNGVTLYDDVYVATGRGARARVEIGNAATYAGSSNIQIAMVTSWSDTLIQANLRQGSFLRDSSAFVYVIDADGNVNADGYPVTIGDQTIHDTTPPVKPKRLRIKTK